MTALPTKAGWMIRALKDQNRPEAVFTVYGGMILEGDDILMATMSLTAAKVRCTSLPNCCGFYSEDWPTDSGLIEGRSEAEQAGEMLGEMGKWHGIMTWVFGCSFPGRGGCSLQDYLAATSSFTSGVPPGRSSGLSERKSFTTLHTTKGICLGWY